MVMWGNSETPASKPSGTWLAIGNDAAAHQHDVPPPPAPFSGVVVAEDPLLHADPWQRPIPTTPPGEAAQAAEPLVGEGLLDGKIGRAHV